MFIFMMNKPIELLIKSDNLKFQISYSIITFFFLLHLSYLCYCFIVIKIICFNHNENI